MPDWCKWLKERSTRFRRCQRRVRLFLLRTVLDLLFARIALRIVPFRWMVRLFERPPRGPVATFARRKRIESSSPVSYSVSANVITDTEQEYYQKGAGGIIELAAFFLPWDTACFPRAVAAQAILRRLGVGTTLFYGVKPFEGRMAAHVWLQNGNATVVGHHEPGEYRVLASYGCAGRS
jgi:hypothetical protein